MVKSLTRARAWRRCCSPQSWVEIHSVCGQTPLFEDIEGPAFDIGFEPLRFRGDGDVFFDGSTGQEFEILEDDLSGKDQLPLLCSWPCTRSWPDVGISAQKISLKSRHRLKGGQKAESPLSSSRVISDRTIGRRRSFCTRDKTSHERCSAGYTST